MKFIDMHCDTLMTTFGHPDTDMWPSGHGHDAPSQSDG